MEQGFLLLLAAMCAAMLSVALWRRSHQRAATARELTREQLARLRDQQQIRKSMEELLLQLDEVSRRINTQIEEKMARLETLLHEADQRLAQLHAGDAPPRPVAATSARARVSGMPRPQVAATATGPHAPAPAVSAPPVLPSGLLPGKSVPASGSPASPTAPPAASRLAELTPLLSNDGVAPPPVRVQRRRRVYELADTGATPMAIANQLRMPLGEVELHLNLRNFVRPAQPAARGTTRST